VAPPTCSFFQQGKSLWNKAIIPLFSSLPESVLARTRAQTFTYRAFLSHVPLSRAPTYEHLEGVRRLRLIPMCLLKPSAPFRRRAWEPEVARCSHPLEEIRFSNPSRRYRRLLRRRHFAILLPSLLHGDGKNIAITTASCSAKALNEVQYKSA